jgi:hypothetical protein
MGKLTMSVQHIDIPANNMNAIIYLYQSWETIKSAIITTDSLGISYLEGKRLV